MYTNIVWANETTPNCRVLLAETSGLFELGCSNSTCSLPHGTNPTMKQRRVNP
jgi:hypothetical protein